MTRAQMLECIQNDCGTDVLELSALKDLDSLEFMTALMSIEFMAGLQTTPDQVLHDFKTVKDVLDFMEAEIATSTSVGDAPKNV